MTNESEHTETEVIDGSNWMATYQCPECDREAIVDLKSTTGEHSDVLCLRCGSNGNGEFPVMERV